MFRYSLLTCVLTAALSSPELARAGQAPAPASESSPVLALLDLAIERGAPLYDRGDPDACLAVYELTARTALALGENSVTPADLETLREGLAAAREERDVRQRAWAFRRAFDTILERGRRERPAVVREASLPVGFPEPGPIDEVVVKAYPEYRMARSDGGRMAFWKLFRHIKSNEIAMTAPVEMTMKPRADDRFEMTDMAFLYATPDLGRTGAQGDVSVIDVDAIRVLSIGLMGPLSDAKVAAARRAIEARVGAGEIWERAGDWRVLGYNSPMVPEARRFYELQVPVRLAVDGSAR